MSNRSVFVTETVYSDVAKGSLCWSFILICFMVKICDDNDDDDDDDYNNNNNLCILLKATQEKNEI
jgi:hypothetical protein